MRIDLKTFILMNLLTCAAFAQVQSTTTKLNQPNYLRALSDFTFNYFAKYTGPSLSDRYEDGATYNRFDGGRTENGERLDATGSTQLYQSFKLGYRLPKNLILSYGVTYQDNLHEDVNYIFIDGNKYQREYGRSFNNHRISLWIPGVYSNKSVSLSLNTFIERPTTESSLESEMRYGLGIQPTLSIISSIPGLFHGITGSVQRDYYKNNEENQSWCQQPGYTCEGVDKIRRTTLFATVGGYLNYIVADNVTFKSNIEFDWDQRGDDVKSLEKFGNNMDNIGNLSVAYRVIKQVTLETGINFAIEEASVDKTAIFGSLDITL